MARSEIAERPPLTVALLATPDSTASTLFGLYDLLLGARRDWQQLLHRADVASPFLPLIVSRDGRSLRVYNDIPVHPHASLDDAPPTDVVIVSNLAVSPWEPLDDRYAPEAQWLCERYAAGATLAAAGVRSTRFPCHTRRAPRHGRVSSPVRPSLALLCS